MPVPPRIELSVDDPEPPFEDAMAVEQQQLSVPMELDCPQRDMPGPLHTQALELSLPAIPSFQISQDQSITGKFAEAPQSPFTNYTQGFSSSPCPFPYASSMPQCVTAPSASSYQESMLPKEPFSAVPYPPDWPRDHQPATITTSVLQPHIAWPFQDFKATETFTFNILPDHAIPHFDFSRPSAPDATPCDDQTDFIMKDVPLDVDAPRPTSTELEPAPTLLAPKRLPETLPVSMFQQPSEVTARPSSPADSARAIAGDDDRHSDTKSSDSDSDDSDTSDSDSEYSDSEGSDSSSDDDSDSGSGSPDDDKDAATVTGPSKPKPKPGKTKVSSSPASDSQSKSQKATNVPN
ncbi:hypothetical protein BC826DRAFT_508334 [Russula brevipes]|nr:hypothetical protein BC826DRAFT_508334 [Russula brevipes]